MLFGVSSLDISERLSGPTAVPSKTISSRCTGVAGRTGRQAFHRHPFIQLDASARRAMVLPTPGSPAEEIEALRAMDDDTDRAIVANEAYKEELVKAMERVDTARKRMRQLEVSKARARLDTAVQDRMRVGQEC